MDASSGEERTEEMLEIGSTLREARGRRGLDLAEIEAATLIRRRYLEALEDEQFELLPPGAYRRSFLKEYAEFLGLDGDTYTSEYDLRLVSQEAEPPSPTPHHGSGLLRLLGELPLTGSVAVASAVALAGIAIWQFGGSGGTGLVKTPPLASQTQPPRRAHRPAVTGQTTPQKPPPSLTLTARHGSCWLSVRIGSSSGPTVYEQTLQPGQTVRFGLRKSLWIRLGAPRNLEARIGSRPVTAALPSHTGDLLATSSGLRPSP